MLGTNVVSDMARRPARAIAQRVAEVGQDAVCLSIVTAGELTFGIAKLPRGSKLASRIEAIPGQIPVLALEPPADAQYGAIRAALEAAGTPIGPNDLLIAAHARATGAVVVTGNIREFGRVEGLIVEDWARAG